MAIYNFTALEDTTGKVISVEADDEAEAKHTYYMLLVENMTEDQLFEIACRALEDYFGETLIIEKQDLH